MKGGIFKYRTEMGFNEVKAPGSAKFLSAALPDENDPPGMVGCWVWMFVPNMDNKIFTYKIKPIVTGMASADEMHMIEEMAYLARLDVKVHPITYRLHMFVNPNHMFVPAQRLHSL
jgi:hypothetical protein